MKKVIFLFSIVLTAVFASCISRSTSVNRGKLTTKTVRTAPFHSIAMYGGVDVHYVQDSVQYVKVTAPAEVMKRFMVYATDSMLIIQPKDNGWRIFKGGSGDIDVYVSSPDLIEVQIAGSGDFEAPGHVDTDNMDLSVAGSGTVEFGSLICNTVSVTVAGSGNIDLKKLTTGKARFSISGSGDIECDRADIYSLESAIAGSGSINVKGKVKTHTEDIGGSGSVTVNGK